MNAMGNALLKGFDRYYNTLIHTGYVNNKTVSQFIVASWIYDVLEGKYDCWPDEDQYKLLSNLYMCLEGSCLVPYQKYCKTVTINKLPDNHYVRMAETNTIDVEGNNAGNKNRMLETSDDLRMI